MINNQELVEKIKLILMYDVEESIINLYLESALIMAKEITKYNTLPSSFEVYIVDSVVEALNRRDSEGLKSENALGVSTTFTYNDMEASLKAKLKNKKNPTSILGYR